MTRAGLWRRRKAAYTTGGDPVGPVLEHSAHERAIALHDKRLEAHGGEIDELRECAFQGSTAIQEANTARQTAAEGAHSGSGGRAREEMDSVVNYALTVAVLAFVVGIATHLGINI